MESTGGTTPGPCGGQLLLHFLGENRHRLFAAFMRNNFVYILSNWWYRETGQKRINRQS